MRPSVTKSKLFVLALLLAFLSSALPSLAAQKSAFMRVYDLKAGHSNRGEVNGNPVNYVDPSGLAPGGGGEGVTPSGITFQTGDIVLRGEPDTNLAGGFYYTHAGIVGINGKILHILGTGIQQDSPANFFQTSFAGVVIRPDVSSQAKTDAIKWLLNNGSSSKFDLNAVWPVDPDNANCVNCAGLVERAYLRSGTDLGLEHPDVAAKTRTKRANLFAGGKPIRGITEFLRIPYTDRFYLLGAGNLHLTAPVNGVTKTNWVYP